MSEPFLSEIKLISWNFAPKGWAFCDGQSLQIAQNQALFALLGTTYGGNGQTTFFLPDLRGRVPIHEGAGFSLGQRAGAETHTLTLAEMPQHVHFMNGSTTLGTLNTGVGNLYGVSQTPVYNGPIELTAINPASVTSVGGSQPHTNMQPFITLNYIIALQGIFPSQN